MESKSAAHHDAPGHMTSTEPTDQSVDSIRSLGFPYCETVGAIINSLPRCKGHPVHTASVEGEACIEELFLLPNIQQLHHASLGPWMWDKRHGADDQGLTRNMYETLPSATISFSQARLVYTPELHAK